MRELGPSLRSDLRGRFIGACGVAALLLLSCEPPRSKNPLSDPKLAKADPRLTGLWRGKFSVDQDKNSDMVIHLTPKGGAALDVVLVGREDKGAQVLAFDAFPSTIGQATYLNLRVESFATDFTDNTKIEGDYLFVKYEFTADGSLKFLLMNSDLMRDAVKAKTLKGTLNDKDDAMLTDDSATLAQFIQADKSGKLFEPWATFKRIPDEKKHR